ncbi:lactate dehydrogenase [Methanocalculus taiwanensis]|uniref:malate dehydrogenase n=1 Tax=Methanocalculus taiwanensis TaxID=106207 RepID=A0ABD4THZ4_9EURY|nr:lactate dehydrogenase [Methanocalculus taiwanensis]MCQ1537917.1 lactate dehydrogenase [Methanocalculus taiwanensis]
MTSLAVLGVGRIGGECAFAAATLGIIDELILADIYKPLLRAQALDLLHTNIEIPISTETARIRDADICIFAAGSPRNPSIKTRADLFDANLPVAQECIQHLKSFEGKLIVVSNPMDIFCYYFQKKLGMPREDCIGFGGQLDSRRFEVALEGRGIEEAAYVLGEHGEHQVPLFSHLGRDILPSEREEILSELRGSSMEIISGKGGTAFGPASHIIDLIRMLKGEKRETITASLSLDGEYGFQNCAMGVPVSVSSDGAKMIGEWPLDAWEREHLDEAGAFLQSLCRRLDV